MTINPPNSGRDDGQAPSDTYWELFPHGADVGVRGVGPSKEAAFEQAACALTGVITDLAQVESLRAVAIDCGAPDDELLLVEWLNALVYEMATQKLLFRRFRVQIDGNRLSGQAWGEPVDVARHEPAAEVKGATLTSVSVTLRADGTWQAQCIVDV